MKLTWKNKDTKKRTFGAVSKYPNLPFGENDDQNNKNSEEQKLGMTSVEDVDKQDTTRLAQDFQAQGEKLAEEGKYKEALGKWEAALTLRPDYAVLHEEKAQILLEIDDPWSALKAATRATELEPSWAEAWITLGRAQLNYGEPDCAIESFDKALSLKPDSMAAQNDRQTALNLVKKRKLLHSSGLSTDTSRFVVNDKTEYPESAYTRSLGSD